ncbi:hypothetical protein [Streptomyces sp. NPDC049040]|uniref:hypothetical protein n=1 Tax=Streptomyces sp. NPDC049040 TaxID=3365593 RepID=UPI0037135A75
MLDEAVVATAASAGGAVVAAAGTDAWTGLRGRLAAWLGHGNARRESAMLAHLDRTAVRLATAEPARLEEVRATCRTAWQTRIEDLLEDLDGVPRALAVASLREVLAEHATAQRQVSADGGALAVGGDLHIRAEGERSVAAGIVRGDVNIGRSEGSPDRPSAPDAFQG